MERSGIRSTPSKVQRYAGLDECVGERALDHPPTPRIVGIALWEADHRVEVLREHDHGDDLEGAGRAGGAKGLAQRPDVVGQRMRPTVAQGHREEVGPTR
jgi:hypothetical protein